MLNFKCALKISSEVRSSLCNYQSIRWRRPRKPFWLGIAKSKMFVIPKVVIPPAEESEEYKRLTRQYNTHMKSLLKFITKTNPLLQERKRTKDEGSVDQEQYAKMISESLERNELWNAESAEFRDKRIKENLEAYMERATSKLKYVKTKENTLDEIVEDAVKKEIERGKSFVTRENLDEAIDNCLKNLVDYNFAIDLEGNKYYRDEMPETKSSKKLEEIVT